VKSETLTIRIEPQTRSMLDFLARHRDQTITKIVERGVKAFAEKDENLVADRGYPFEQVGDLRPWPDYWHADEGVRAVKRCVLNGIELTEQEEQLRELVLAHQDFFFEYRQQTDEHGDNLSIDVVFNQDNIEALWGELARYRELWIETRATDRFAAGAAMKKALEDAGYPAPGWPPPPEKQRSRTSTIGVV
jgi:hypothetical protein